MGQLVALRLLTTTLKNLAIELNAFVMTATQVSGDDDVKGGFKDFRNLRGSRAIGDLADVACIRRRPSVEELAMVSAIEKRYNLNPNMITDVFKNRRGRWTMLSIWSAVDLGTLRFKDLFVTTANYKPIPDFQIVDITPEKTQESIDLENLYNTGEISENLEQIMFAEQEVTSNEEEMLAAFGTQKLKEEKFKNMSFDELF